LGSPSLRWYNPPAARSREGSAFLRDVLGISG
jgi:hypothetical protein